MAAKFWSKVQVAMQSAVSADVTITDINKQAANQSPRQVEHGGADPSDGDYVCLDVQGMFQLNDIVARVDNSTTGSFDLEGFDTTNYDDFTSGTFCVITFGTTLATVTDVSASGGDPEFADITTIHDNIRKQVPVVTSPLSFSFESIWDPSDAGLTALQAASRSIEERAFKFTFADGTIVVFNGYVSAPMVPTGSAQDKVTTPITITTNGFPTSYTT